MIQKIIFVKINLEKLGEYHDLWDDSGNSCKKTRFTNVIQTNGESEHWF